MVKISKEHIEIAVILYDKSFRRGNYDSGSKYALIHEKTKLHYPPKAIYSIASGKDVSHFSGTAAKKKFDELGYMLRPIEKICLFITR